MLCNVDEQECHVHCYSKNVVVVEEMEELLQEKWNKKAEGQ